MKTNNYKEMERNTKLEILALKQGIELFEKALPIVTAHIGKTLNKRLETKIKAANINLSLSKYEYGDKYNLDYYSQLTGKNSPDRNGYATTNYPHWYRSIEIELYFDDNGKLVNTIAYNNRLKQLKESLTELELTISSGRNAELTKKMIELKTINNGLCDSMTFIERDFYNMRSIY